MAKRQQLIVDTKTPAACAGSSSPYIVSYRPSSGGSWAKEGDNINGEDANGKSGVSVSLSSDGNVVAIGADRAPPSNTGSVSVYAWNGTTWEKRGGDIDGEASGDLSGHSVSLSSDGTIVAIGAYDNDGGGNRVGHVRVYQYDATKTTAETDQSSSDFGPVGWRRLGADIDGDLNVSSNPPLSGRSVSLSSDGSIVAIGATGDDGSNTNAGHVRVYQYDATKTTAQLDESQAGFGPVGWNRLGADIDGEAAQDNSGYSLSLSSDGTIVAIGAYGNDAGTANGIYGHVRVYKYDATKTTAETDQTDSNFGPVGWNRLGADIDGEAAYDYSGRSVSLSSDGSIVAIGAYRNDSSFLNAGHVRVYKYDSAKTTAETDQSSSDFGPVGWRRLGVDIDGEAAEDQSADAHSSVSLSSDGTIVAIGAYFNDGDTGNASDNRGHVRVYEYSGSSWSQIGTDIDGEAANDLSGWSVSLNDNGRTVAIGAPYADSNGLDSNGNVRVYRMGSSISPQVGDWAVAKHKETDTGADLSTYTYRVTHVADPDTLVLEFVSATDGYADDSTHKPCDLCDGTGPPGDCPIAPHVIKRDLGGMFMMLLD